MAWGERMGICQGEFVVTLRGLPAPAPRGDGKAEPDMRRVVRDLGAMGYDTMPGCAQQVRS